MKNKILTFIIGVLVGAIIATTGFLIYEKVKGNNSVDNQSNMSQMMQDGDGKMAPPDMQSNDSGDNQTTRPNKPSGEMGNNQGTPPEKPSGDNTNGAQNQSNTTSNNSNESSNS